MKIAILSDLHSNSFALKAVLDDFENRGIDRLIILGDIFGYYPWACETDELLRPYKESAFIIKGNHDQLLLDADPPKPVPSYWEAAKQNEATLKARFPETIKWLNSLDFEMKVELAGRHISMVHGTPADKMEGRYYPDDMQEYSWFPKNGSILLLGHTHYPIYKKMDDNSVLINPGSVGQPRDSDPMPSWGILNTADSSFQLIRTPYDNFEVMDMLEKMHWDKRAIAALHKTNKGSLKI